MAPVTLPAPVREVTTALAAKDLPCLAAAAAPTGLFLLDAAGDATYVNPRLGEILGACSESLLGPALVERLLGAECVGDLQRIGAAFALGRTGESTHDVGTSDRTQWLRVLASRSRDAAGIVGVVEDVTSARTAAGLERRIEAARERARRLDALGMLAGGVAHDFNNLLVGIVGNATLAELDMDPDSEATAALADLRLSAERATDLTGQLLVFGGRGAAAPQPVDAVGTVDEALASPGFAAARERIAREVAPTLPRVMCDPARLRQAVTHLVLNAVEALPASGGRVTVRAGTTRLDAARLSDLVFDGGIGEGARVFIEVEDTGHGMSATAIDRAFDPFVTTKGKRRGMGLAMVAGMARTYAAGIEVTSEEGRGTIVRLLLPPDASRPAVPSPRTTAAVGAGPHAAAILVVDDEAAVRSVTRRLLAREGYEVLEASCGEEALQALSGAKDRIRCVLLDHSMPGMDGTETYRRLREVSPGVRVVMTSGHSERDLRARFDDAGIAGYLQKPFDLSALLRAARAAIAD